MRLKKVGIIKYIYIIASGAAKKISSEQILWNTICSEGLTVRDIHDLPRIAQHEIAIADAKIARLVKELFEKEEKKVKLICLITSEEVIQQRLKGFSQEDIVRISKDLKKVALQDADFCVPADDLEVAAGLIINIIKNQEASP